jgi:signal transduction histidine kinase
MRVAPETREAVVRIVREAVANAVRHGQVETVSVGLHAQGERALRLVVRDEGGGFEPGVTVAAGHVGLQSMADRAAAVGAVLTVSSAPGAGTSVEVVLP